MRRTDTTPIMDGDLVAQAIPLGVLVLRRHTGCDKKWTPQ